MDTNIIREIPIFEDLDNADIEKIVKIAIGRKYKKGEILCHEGDIGNSMYIIKSGKVKILKTSEEGKEKILTIFSEGDFLGEMSLVDEEARSATVEAMEDTETYIIYKKDFIEMLNGSFVIVMKLLSTLSRRIRTLNNKIEILTFRDVHARFADVIMELKEKYGIVKKGKILIDLSLTHKDLASMLGVTRETMTRIISKMKKQNILTIEDKKMMILDEKRLIDSIE